MAVGGIVFVESHVEFLTQVGKAAVADDGFHHFGAAQPRLDKFQQQVGRHDCFVSVTVGLHFEPLYEGLHAGGVSVVFHIVFRGLRAARLSVGLYIT